jgi:hypothetical protein
MRRAALVGAFVYLYTNSAMPVTRPRKNPGSHLHAGVFWSEESRIVASLFPSDANVKGFFQSSSKTRYKNEMPPSRMRGLTRALTSSSDDMLPLFIPAIL